MSSRDETGWSGAGGAVAHTLVFLVGLHRSGTSLLNRLVQAHPEVSGFSGTGAREDEGQHLQSVVPTAKNFGGPGAFGHDPRSHLDETSALATVENAATIYNEWARYWNLDKRFLLEKSPTTLVRMRFFQALFPDSAFVVIFRHPIAVAAATTKWNEAGLCALVEHTLICYECALADLAHIRRAFVLRYEDFVADPRRGLGAVFEFLGIAPVDAAEPVRTGVNEVYYDVWRRGIIAPIGRRRFASSAEARAQRFGYSLVEPERLAPLRLPGLDIGVFSPQI